LNEWEDKSRIGDYVALRHVPKDGNSVVVRGFVSSRQVTMVTQDGLLSELDTASKFIDPARSAISPQFCSVGQCASATVQVMAVNAPASWVPMLPRRR
jgi:hypothetical protein